MVAIDHFLFAVFPYLAIVIGVGAAWYRYKKNSFTVSSLSSSFLEPRAAFYGSVPFHVGMLLLLLGHLVGFLIPRGVLAWNRVPLRLIILEVAGFGFAVCVLVGLLILFVRRLSKDRVLAVTSPMDIAIESLLIIQVLLGLITAYNYRFGSTWFATVISPYLWSVLALAPKAAAISALPLVVKLHITFAFLLLLLLPFSRLMHFLVAPLHYIYRPYQRVIWYRNRKRVRDPLQGYMVTRPRNN